MNQGLIFDIKRYAINDGPGIRITLFFKGCPLSCAWCHNPESQSPDVQKLYTASKCIGAQDCVTICPNDALTLTSEGIVTDFEACNLCGKCAEACPTTAIEMSGKLYTVDELMKVVEKERLLFDQSGGGVTVSGGEPLMYPEFLIELLEACGEKGIHRTVDTCGFAATDVLLKVAQQTDLFLYDLKIMDPVKHKQFTGVDNKLILKNLQILAETGANINIRIPFIQNVNADGKTLIDMAQFIRALPGETPKVNLLPYHEIAINKYNKLGQTYFMGEMEEPTEQQQNDAIAIFDGFEVEAEIGG